MTIPGDNVIIVNEQDEWLGTMDKLKAHQLGALHRAFSIFILNHKNELLLQQRADGKYHSAGLWSNTCCSHPKPLESTMMAAHRRLQEEMGFDCELTPLFTLRYKTHVDNDLIENEFDHIFSGVYNGIIQPNADEVKDAKFISLPALEAQLKMQPEVFTAWLHLAFPDFIKHLQVNAD